jgi:hypothetical protein
MHFALVQIKIILLPIPFPRKVLVTTVTLLPATHSFSIGSSVSNLPEQCLHTVLFGIKTKLSPLLCTFCMIPELNTLVNASVGPNGIFSNEWQMILGLEEFGDVSFSELTLLWIQLNNINHFISMLHRTF